MGQGAPAQSTVIAATTPLSALRMVSVDTETTGLDTRSSRIVQIGAVRLTGEEVAADEVFESLVNPAQPIPAASTAIHHISDEDVADATDIAAALPRFLDFAGDAVLIGHTIGFDIEMMAAEAGRVCLPWRSPRVLCVRLMARVALPTLPDHTLDGLCAHFGIEIEGRHTALGDAVAAARVFAALIPHLREAGVRTLAEAESALRAILAREAQENGGKAPFALPEPEAHAGDTAPMERIDSYPYRSSVAEAMSSPPVLLAEDQPLRAALDMLIERKVSSVFVGDGGPGTGILTERDVLRALHADRAAVLDKPVAAFRTVPLHTISANALVYRAIGRMDRLGIRHLGVTDDTGRVVGAITTRNLLRHRAGTAMILGDEIAAADSGASLAESWAKVPAMARLLGEEGVDPRATAGVISAEIRMMTRRAAQLAEMRLMEDGKGPPPCAYAVLVLGSGGRGESLIAADQDNAIVYETGEPGGVEDQWFAALGGHIADMLDAAGIPYYKGGVMAREPAWRRSLAGWRQTVDDWVTRQSPDDLLNVDIYFDAAIVYGNRALGGAAWEYAWERGGRERTFWRALGETLRIWRSPVGTFSGFRTGADERVDLKLGGLMPIFTAGRILALKAGKPLRATPERLRAAAEAGLASPDQIEGLVEAHRVILGAMLRQQIADTAAGVSPGPRVDPRILSKAERSELRTVLRRVQGAIDLVREGML